MNGQADFPCYPFASVVPHQGDMVLLDKINTWDNESLTASVMIRPDAPFTDAQGMPAWVGAELMAQTIGAYGGTHARKNGQPVKIGFLVGSRRYSASQGYFPLGASLQVQVREVLRSESGLSVFECHLTGQGEHAHISASANINVFQPADPEAFLAAGAGAIE